MIMPHAHLVSGSVCHSRQRSLGRAHRVDVSLRLVTAEGALYDERRARVVHPASVLSLSLSLSELEAAHAHAHAHAGRRTAVGYSMVHSPYQLPGWGQDSLTGSSY